MATLKMEGQANPEVVNGLEWLKGHRFQITHLELREHKNGKAALTATGTGWELSELWASFRVAYEYFGPVVKWPGAAWVSAVPRTVIRWNGTEWPLPVAIK